MAVRVNGQAIASRTPGSYLSLDWTWADGDTIEFVPPIGFTPDLYTGLDQVAGNLDRCALLYGPILLAPKGALEVLAECHRSPLPQSILRACCGWCMGSRSRMASRGYQATGTFRIG
jgi:DUF1680 family protein